MKGEVLLMDKIIQILTNNNLIKTKEDEAIIRYGLELLLNAVVSVSILLTLGAVLGIFWETLIFYITYLFLKKNTGGYHADSHIGCITQFNLFCLILFLLQKHHLILIPRLVIHLFLIICVFGFAPVKSENKKISPQKMTCHKKTARIKCLIVCVLSPVLKRLHFPESLLQYYYLGLLMICITILLGARKNHLTSKGGCHEKHTHCDM